MIARIELKDGVTLVGNRYVNEMLRAVQIAFGDHGLPVATITSGVDGVHGLSSYHAKGRAVDVRFWGVPDEKRLDVALSIRQWLPAFYDVVTEVDHYHLEADADKEKGSH